MKARRVLDLLRDAALKASLVSAEFGSVTRGQIKPERPVTFADGRIVTESNVTEFIRERVRIHHATWIIGYIHMAMAEVQSTLPHKFEGTQYACHACGKAVTHRSHTK